eukprot:16294269-Heterocapsa_arctica.AAC.1
MISYRVPYASRPPALCGNAARVGSSWRRGCRGLLLGMVLRKYPVGLGLGVGAFSQRLAGVHIA